MRVYLDIDGVLIDKQGMPADGVGEFLHWVTANHECHWLTTHCKGDASTAVRYLQRHLPPECWGCLKKILPTNWDALKTEGIAFEIPFVWMDDAPLPIERRLLMEAGLENCLLLMDLRETRALESARAFIVARGDRFE